MAQRNLFQSDLKTIGLLSTDTAGTGDINEGPYQSYIKVLYLPKGYRVKVDFSVYTTEQASLFFVAPNQFLKIEKTGTKPGHFIFYNRDFYCIHLHDDEVACDGLLYNNINNMPMISVSDSEAAFIDHLFHQMQTEFAISDNSKEEMIRTYLKQLFIKSTRLWKNQHLDKTLNQQNQDLDFFRKFTLLVDAHYKQKHSVVDYADLLHLAPKSITHKFRRLHLPQPNEIIKNRIVLEAKRLLVHSFLTAKEIAYELGYEDPAYFSRMFQIKTGQSPSGFRTKYLGAAVN